MTTSQTARPDWYTEEDDTAWERVKAAFRRDWSQTKHDFGGDAPDLNQHVSDTVAQATGSESIPPANVPAPPHSNTQEDIYRDSDEPAYQYGYAAHRHYGNVCEWDLETEDALRKDFGDDSDWEQKRHAVRRGWFYSQKCGNGCRE